MEMPKVRPQDTSKGHVHTGKEVENNLLGNPGNPANPSKNITTKISSHNRLETREPSMSLDPHLNTHLDVESMTVSHNHLTRR